MKYLLKDKVLIVLLLLGLFSRLFFCFLPAFKIDMDAWFAWAVRLNQVGFSGFYSEQVWTNYTPGYLYVLFVLDFIKNLFHINNSLFILILKIPSIVAELILGIFVYRQFINRSLLWAIAAASLILFNPVFIFNSSVWGQIDGLLSLMLVLTIYFLIQKKFILSSTFLGLGFLIKPQTIALLPIFALFLLKNFSAKKFLKIGIPFLLTVFLLSLPFFTNQLLSGIPKLFSKMVSDYPYSSLYAYNLWGIVGFWIPDNQLWNNLSYQTWGYILLAGYWIILGYLYLKNKLSIYAAAALAEMGFFFLPTRVHERYLYPALIFLILIAAYLRSKSLLILISALSVLHLLNLYYVYVYYNEIFLKLPKIFYNPLLYNFVSSSGKILSLISVLIFLFISIVILKHNVTFKED